MQEPFFQDAASLVFLHRVTLYRNSHLNSFVQYKALGEVRSREGFTMIPLHRDVLHFFALFNKDYAESPDLVDFHDCLASGE